MKESLTTLAFEKKLNFQTTSIAFPELESFEESENWLDQS